MVIKTQNRKQRAVVPSVQRGATVQPGVIYRWWQRGGDSGGGDVSDDV